MIRMRFTFIVFQEGQPEEQVQTFVEFKDATELAMEMARLAAHNSIVFAHPMIQCIEKPSKIIARVSTRKGMRPGTSIVISDVEECVEPVPPELARDPELLMHAAVARRHALRKNNDVH